jgi:response regulator NasT
MNHILVAFSGEKTRQRMTDIFETTGIRVSAACGSGAEVLRWCGRMSGGVILSGYKLYDMMAEELFENLPPGFSMLLLATEGQLECCENEEICKLSAPVSRSELVDSVRMLLGQTEAELAPVPIRSSEDKQMITKAKELLMTRNCMTEEQAHRFIQKRSMDTGAKMIQTALMILDGQIVI